MENLSTYEPREAVAAGAERAAAKEAEAKEAVAKSKETEPWSKRDFYSFDGVDEDAEVVEENNRILKNMVISEITTYVHEPRIAVDSCPLDWWKVFLF